jgi:ribosomal protein L22
MQSKKPVPESIVAEGQRKAEEEREKLVVQTVKLPNGATFTRLKPVGMGRDAFSPA